MTGLAVPQLPEGADALTAVLVYAEADWYVLPVRAGSKKPGSVVGDNWHTKSSRDPKQLAAWYAGTDYGIALHCGRSGAVVFDVDDPSALPDVLFRNLNSTPYQSTRPDVLARGHYIFRMPTGRVLGNSTGQLGGAWGEIRGLNGVIIVEPSRHKDGGCYRWLRTGVVPELPAEIADLLPEASPAEDAATDEDVSTFIAQHRQSTRPGLIQGFVSALSKRFNSGESRHQSTVPVLAGAMKEASVGLYPAQAAIDALRPMFLEAVAKPAVSGKQGAPRNGSVAAAEFNSILAWAVGQARGASPAKIKARVEEKMPDRTSNPDEHNASPNETDDDETVRTVPWPTLNKAALHGNAGKIVNLIAPHTEADPAAVLAQLLAEFGATIGSEPHFIAGNDRHQAIINPLIVGRTNNGAKGTGLAVVEAIRQRALPWFDEFTTSGLSSAEGLIEMVRDPSGDPEDKDYDPGAVDKRLLVRESEYKSVLVRMRREGNTLGPTLRDTFDCRTLRTLTRKHNRLTATGSHIVVIGHITPGEFRATLQDSDLSGGTVNRMLICLSRRSRLHSRLGNLPGGVLAAAAELFEGAYKTAVQRREVAFTDRFWALWDAAYRELNRDRPDSRATEATARAVTMVLRLSLLYALIDGSDTIDAEHLDPALALWAYAEHSARWLFSSHELEVQRESAGGLANFILGGEDAGRTRTEISRDYFKGNKTAAEINVELAPLVHDGVVIEIKEEWQPTTPGRAVTRYVHRSLRNNESTKRAGQETNPVTKDDELTKSEPPGEADLVRKFVYGPALRTPSELHSSSNSLIRSPEHDTAATNPHTNGHSPPCCRHCQAVLLPEEAERGHCPHPDCTAAARANLGASS